MKMYLKTSSVKRRSFCSWGDELTGIAMRSLISNYGCVNGWDITAYPYACYNGGIIKLLSMLCHGRVTTSDIKAMNVLTYSCVYCSWCLLVKGRLGNLWVCITFYGKILEYEYNLHLNRYSWRVLMQSFDYMPHLKSILRIPLIYVWIFSEDKMADLWNNIMSYIYL